jgi:plastocyanin
MIYINRLLALFLVFLSVQSFAATVVVDIRDFSFSPQTVTINLGDTVKWINKGAFSHTTTSNSTGWNQTLAPGQSYSRVFNTENSFTYHCNFHQSMTGTIVVRSPEQTRIKTGQDILATMLPTMTLNLTGKSAPLVYLGSYIVNAQSACANCHSCPTYAAGHNPYNGQSKRFNVASYLAGGVKVTGNDVVAVSANLTPDASGKPAGMTLADFKTLLRTGHDPDMGGAPLQVMPWPFFGMMSDHDLNAIYEYLRSIPSRTTPTALCSSPGK